MGEGVVQLLFIVAVILASVFDAVGRNRKRREQEASRGAEADLEAEGVEGEDFLDEEWDVPEPWEPEGALKAEPAPPVSEPRRTSAEELLPPDLWAILTGQPPRPRTEEPAGQGMGADAPARASAPSSRPTPLGGGAIPSAPTETRRSARWMEGVTDAARPRPPESTTAAGDGPRRAAITGAGPAASPSQGAMVEPWGALPDITVGEIGSAPIGQVDRKNRRPTSGQRGGVGGTLVRGLVGSSVSELRSAILLREVLGPPVGSQDLDRSPRDRS